MRPSTTVGGAGRHVTSDYDVIRPAVRQVSWMGVWTNRDGAGHECSVFDREISDRDTHINTHNTHRNTRASIRRAHTRTHTEPESDSPAWNTLAGRKRRQVTCHHVQEKEVYHNTYRCVSQLLQLIVAWFIKICNVLSHLITSLSVCLIIAMK